MHLNAWLCIHEQHMSAFYGGKYGNSLRNQCLSNRLWKQMTRLTIIRKCNDKWTHELIQERSLDSRAEDSVVSNGVDRQPRDPLSLKLPGTHNSSSIQYENNP